MASAIVKAYEDVSYDSQSNLVERCSTRTDIAGSYLCTGLAAGRYYLFVKIDDGSRHSSFTPAFALYYQTVSLSDAEPVIVRAGQSQLIEIGVGSYSSFTVTGRLLARPQSPLVSLRTLGRHGESVFTGLTPSYDPLSGAFSFRSVPPGQYSLLAFWHDDERVHSDEVAVTVTDHDVLNLPVQDADAAHLIFELQPCEAGSEPVETLYLKGEDGRTVGGEQIAAVSPGTKNRFEFYPIPSGKYFVDIGGSVGGYISETSLGPGVYSGNLISIPAGSGSVIVQAQIGCDAAKLAGRIDSEVDFDGQAFVFLRSLTTGETFQQNTTNGTFAFSGIAPGDYGVYAFPASGQNNYKNESGVTGGTSITLYTYQKANIVVSLTK